MLARLAKIETGCEGDCMHKDISLMANAKITEDTRDGTTAVSQISNEKVLSHTALKLFYHAPMTVHRARQKTHTAR